VESVHAGAVAVVEGDRTLYARGPVDERFYLRSCAKPFQSWTVVDCGAADACGLAAEEIAVMSGSHGGEPEHVRAVASILRKARMKPSALRCGTHPPISPKGLKALARDGKEPGVLHNNCSGKHAGMVAAARHLGARVETYLDPRHPLQRRNLETVARFSGVPARRIGLGVDGCSAPTFALPVRAMARAIGRFCAEDVPARRVREAMMAHPAMVGRPCVQLMSAAPGKVLGKVGAEGVYVCGLPGRGIGIALKVADGSVRPVVHVLAALFRKLGLLGKPDLARLEKVADPVLRNHAGLVVGELRTRV
jgi:L-asparaginase II